VEQMKAEYGDLKIFGEYTSRKGWRDLQTGFKE
jgi:hypothetical protein